MILAAILAALLTYLAAGAVLYVVGWAFPRTAAWLGDVAAIMFELAHMALIAAALFAVLLVIAHL